MIKIDENRGLDIKSGAEKGDHNQNTVSIHLRAAEMKPNPIVVFVLSWSLLM